MREELVALLDYSYTPYYQYPVSSILVMKDGSKYRGVNVETSSPAAGICAERNAITTAIADGYKKGDFKELHVMVSGNEVGMPCFICRQALADFFESDALVYCYSKAGGEEVHTIAELCPYPFGSEDLL